MCNNKVIQNSRNKSKAPWGVVKNELGMKEVKQNFPYLLVNGSKIKTGLGVATHLNDFFMSSSSVG
jgi:hypothetical protein